MDEILEDLCTTDGVLGGLLMSNEGDVVARRFDTGSDADLVGALVTSCLQSIASASDDLGIGALKSVMLEAEKNLLFVRHTAAGTLIVLAARRANPGLVRVEMDLAAERIGRTPIL
jgi:predicted regulator of Ras-like GTPase activity (Roadblock/LC7/MglB family)